MTHLLLASFLSPDVSGIVQHGGLLLLAVFLFAEVGLFLGFFLPGDTLLIAAGIYAHQGKMNLALVILVSAVAAIAGDNLAYFIGKHLGHRVFTKEDGVIFQKSHIEKAEKFFDKHGPKTLLISHALPFVRTFTPLLAGVGKMQWRRFVAFNIVGDAAWALVVTLLGYYVGSRIPNVDHYILLGLLIVVVVSAAPTLFHVARLYWRKKRSSK